MRRILIALGAVAALAMGGLAYAASAASGGSTQPSPAPVVLTAADTPAPSRPGAPKAAPSRAAHRRAGGVPGLVRRVVHAELVVREKGGAFKTIDIDRGTIDALSSRSITVTRPDKVSVTEAIESTTRFPGRTESRLKVGEKVVVISSASRATAVRSPGAHRKGGAPKPPGAKPPTAPTTSTTVPATTAGPPTTS